MRWQILQRRWFRFSVRTLLLLVLVTAVALTWVMRPHWTWKRFARAVQQRDEEALRSILGPDWRVFAIPEPEVLERFGEPVIALQNGSFKRCVYWHDSGRTIGGHPLVGVHIIDFPKNAPGFVEFDKRSSRFIEPQPRNLSDVLLSRMVITESGGGLRPSGWEPPGFVVRGSTITIKPASED